MNLRVILILAFGALVSILAIQNTEVVAIRFLFWEFFASRIIFFAITLVAGMVIGYSIALLLRLKGALSSDSKKS